MNFRQKEVLLEAVLHSNAEFTYGIHVHRYDVSYPCARIDFARLHPGGSLGRRLLMTVGNVMHKEGLPVVAPDCSAKDMIHAVSKGGLGLIVICEGDKVLGIVTDGDIRRAMERRESEFFSIRAMDIATPNPKTIGPDEKLIAAEKKMTQHKINSLLVTDDQGKLVGVIQIYDIKL